ncbi:G patch domain-containing protein 4 isoform X2 [Rhineura floridana]|nr:G patch domain-containing protein 4 isoform X2 [Rhineura floridana]
MCDASPATKSKGLKFAEKQLKRHGWKKGKGLGKLENGISEAIKVKVKCDSAGVGHNAAEQFTFHWWDHLFNSSAANIAVETGQDSVRVKKVSEEDSAITNKKPRRAQGNKNLLYGRFVKAATLTPGGEEPMTIAASSDSDEEDEDEKLDLSTARRLTDEELVQACGGRTAHKGARHGLNMAAKLARLEEQEKAFLAHCAQQKGGVQEATAAASNDSSLQQKQKKAKKRKERQGEAVAYQSPETRGEKPKKKKKQQQEESGESKSARLPVLAITDPKGKWAEIASRGRKSRETNRKAE